MSEQFEQRKRDHIRLALSPATQATGLSGLDRYQLIHEALPDLDFKDIDLRCKVFGEEVAAPLFVSSMTAGHSDSTQLNLKMARVCEKRNWAMAVGSQRRQLEDGAADREWTEIRKQCSQVKFYGNIGLSQIIGLPTDRVKRLAETLQASAMIVHLNPLQECLQPEGTPEFKGGLDAIKKLTRELTIPVIVKETGCGFSKSTLERLSDTGIKVVDVAGLGGTHWGRIEGGRSPAGEKLSQAAETFRNWGVGTVESLLNAMEIGKTYEVWASGGVRSGLDAAILLAMGAKMVGFAKPIIEAALLSEESLDQKVELLEYELKVALFCTGSRTVNDLQEKRAWQEVRT